MKMILMQGLPGSGKSTKAREIKNELEPQGNFVDIFSTDDFYMVDGAYVYDKTKANVNHFRNQLRCWRVFEQTIYRNIDKTVVIIDNTNLTNQEISPYLWIARQFKYAVEIEVIRCTGNFKSTHDVPEEIIEKMRERMEVINLEGLC